MYNINVWYGLLIPFIGTILGAAMVYLLKDKIKEKLEKILLGFASGVMLAASFWSLLGPSIEIAENQGIIAWIPAAVGFLFGILFLLILDKGIPHLHATEQTPEGSKCYLRKSTMLFLAVTIHNIPEGMAVGIIFAGFIANNSAISFASALILSIGIALQNFPEGAVVSMPLKNSGISKNRAFLYGVFSGIVEPIAAIMTILLTSLVLPILPYLLSFAAGTMIYVVVENLIPQCSGGKHSDLGTIGLSFGFVLMMILDISFG